jgi:HTH-type transcriptional regulator / antitoxin HipB
MSDLKKYVEERKKRDLKFAKSYDSGYKNFKIGVMLRQAREDSGKTQEEIAHEIHIKKSAISRIENHAEDIRLQPWKCSPNRLVRSSKYGWRDFFTLATRSMSSR